MNLRKQPWIRRMASIATGVALLAGIAGSAGAADFCLSYFDGQNSHLVVLKSFKTPGKGRCKAFSGFDSSSSWGTYDLTGGACTASEGGEVRFTWTAGRGASSPLFLHASLPLPLGPAATELDFYGINNKLIADFLAPKACPKSVVPIP
jgi:hypothetical protein